MKQAFTLIELLVVVLIIGILSAIALPQYTKAVEKARASEAVMNMSNLQKGVDMYLLENGYPSSTKNFLKNNPDATLDIDITQGLTCNDTACSNRYFQYDASCGAYGCSIHAYCFHQSGSDNEYAYWLYMHKSKSTDTWDAKECIYDEPKEYICKGLESQGYERSSCC